MLSSDISTTETIVATRKHSCSLNGFSSGQS